MMKILKKNNNVPTAISFELITRYASLLIWYHQVDVSHRSAVYELADRVKSLWTNNGKVMTVAYLKEATRICQFFAAGNYTSCDTKVRVATRSGLPLIIPSPLRQLLHSYDKSGVISAQGRIVWKVILALLGLYRVIKYPGQKKLSTITDPFKGSSETLNVGELALLWAHHFKPLAGKVPVGEMNLLPMRSAGPNSKISMLGAPYDAYYLATKAPALIEALATVNQYFHSGISYILDKEIEYLSSLSEIMDLAKEKALFGNVRIGKLSLKEEPAGKIRVFAIGDVYSQSSLRPIHDHIFSILEKIPQDGTFNQGRPLKYLVDSLNERSNEILDVYSYDLSAATDRVPIAFQVQILSLLYNYEIARAWKTLMVDRDWNLEGVDYRYTVGQPMGMLSSWGAFALSHHVALQLAARRVGREGWFSDYALLGDDIVIADKAVAESYFNLMTNELGVDINLSKSLVSNKGVFEFAKRLVTLQGELTPLGPKNLVLALKTKEEIPSLFIDGLGKGDSFEANEIVGRVKSLTPDIIRLSAGDKESLILALLKPFGVFSSRDILGSERVTGSFRNYSMTQVLVGFAKVAGESYYNEFYSVMEYSICELRSIASALVPLGDVRRGDFLLVPFRSFPSYHSIYIEALTAVINKYDHFPNLNLFLQRRVVQLGPYLWGLRPFVNDNRGLIFFYHPQRWNSDQFAKMILDQRPELSKLDNLIVKPIVRAKRLGNQPLKFFKGLRVSLRETQD